MFVILKGRVAIRSRLVSQGKSTQGISLGYLIHSITLQMHRGNKESQRCLSCPLFKRAKDEMQNQAASRDWLLQKIGSFRKKVSNSRLVIYTCFRSRFPLYCMFMFFLPTFLDLHCAFDKIQSPDDHITCTLQ